MLDIHNGRPGDVRNFVHKRIIGAVSGFIAGGPVGGIAGFFGGGRKAAPVAADVIPTTTVFPGSGGRGFAPGGARCATGFFLDPSGNCVPLVTRPGTSFIDRARQFLPGGQTGQVPFGEAVNGQFGAALEPGFRDTSTAVCPRGTVLGVDGLCYNKRDLRNSERKWPVGRKPLLTGGEMRCISIAAGAAKRLQRKQKQLMKMGMLPKPASSRRRALPAGHDHAALHIPVHSEH